jgi:hypothetical protein
VISRRLFLQYQEILSPVASADSNSSLVAFAVIGMTAHSETFSRPSEMVKYISQNQKKQSK